MLSFGRILGFIAVVAGCLGSGFLVLLPLNPIFWQVSWAIALVTGIALAIKNASTLRYFLFHRATRYGANLCLVAGIAIGIALALNYVGARYKKRFDLTSVGRFTLSEQTQKVLSELKRDVKIYYFFQPGPEMAEAQKLLDMYKNASRAITYEMHHVNANPTLARSLGIEKVNEGEQVFVITAAASAAEGEAKARNATVRGVSEEKLTNGIVRLLKSQDQTVYFLTGHGERSYAEPNRADSLSELKRLIENEVYTVKSFAFDSGAEIPRDAALLVIAGPKSEFPARELEALSAYLLRGGRLLIAFDIDLKGQGLPRGARQLADLVKRVGGIYIGEKLLVDVTSRLYQLDGQVLLATADSASHPITKDFPRTALQAGFAAHFYFPYAVRIAEESVPEGVEYASLVKTSSAAWEESSWAEIRTQVVKFTKGEDRQAAMTLGAALKSERPEAPWRIVAFGSSGFMTNGAILAKHDKDIVLNAINWLADQEALISIRPKPARDVTLEIDANLYNFIVLVLMIALPVAILGTGVWIWFQRRSK